MKTGHTLALRCCWLSALAAAAAGSRANGSGQLCAPPAGCALQYGGYFSRANVSAPTDYAPNTVWYYAPTRNTSGPDKPPLLVQFHGGGFVHGSPDVSCTDACQLAVASGMAYASVGYRFVTETYYYGAGAEEELLVLVDRAGALSVAADGRKMSDYKVRTGNQELITKCVHDAKTAMDFLLQANKAGTYGVSFDADRVGFTGSSAGGAEMWYLSLVCKYTSNVPLPVISARFSFYIKRERLLVVVTYRPKPAWPPPLHATFSGVP